MLHRSRIALALVATLALTLVATRVTAATFMPLEPGTVWVYQGDQGGHQTERMIGFFPLHGRPTAIKHYEEGVDAGLQNYWMIGFDGTVLLAGFSRPGGAPGSFDTGYVYDPPIRIFPVPPVVGPQPFQFIGVYDFVTDVLLYTAQIRYDVFEDVVLTLPAGTFHAYGAGQYIPLPAPAANGTHLTLDGRLVTDSGKNIAITTPTDWYSEGVGLVQYRTSQLYQLTSFSGPPTATAQSSWGKLKRLYR